MVVALSFVKSVAVQVMCMSSLSDITSKISPCHYVCNC
jgi:hypothetical protein